MQTMIQVRIDVPLEDFRVETLMSIEAAYGHQVGDFVTVLDVHEVLDRKLLQIERKIFIYAQGPKKSPYVVLEVVIH